MATQNNVVNKARSAKSAQRALSTLSDKKRRAALKSVANALRFNSAKIINANQVDVELAGRDVKAGKLSPALLRRLMVSEDKIATMAAGVDAVARLPDPVGRIASSMELDEGLLLEQVTCPIGVIGAVFESRPDAAVQIAALCLKSGNAVLLKGGSEAKETNRILVKLIASATGSTGFVPRGWIGIIETRDDVRQVLELDEYIDLLIPRGSNEFVRYIQSNTQIPVLGHADGICHVYVDKRADIEMAIRIVLDSKTQYPAVCNAAETLLVHREIADRFLPKVTVALRKAGVEIRGCAKTRQLVSGLKSARRGDWNTEYLDLILAVKIVESQDQAVDHINRYGSGHTDCIVTKSNPRARSFMSLVDSACVFHNASTRFADGYRFGLGAELGISTNKTHARGPVGLEGLVIYNYHLRGQGHIVADYSGKNPRKFTHRKIS